MIDFLCVFSVKLLGGLVWILVASSDVPVPLLQGWVIFVSLISFLLSSAYLTLLVTGLADLIVTNWNFLVNCRQQISIPSPYEQPACPRVLTWLSPVFGAP